jgi:acyl carrier protein
MASTEDRLRALLTENLEVDGKPIDAGVDFSNSLTDLGVSSLDIVEFGKLVSREFNITIDREKCPIAKNLQELVQCIDANSG